MTRLVWNAVGERIFEAGVDRGVLFVSGVGVPWNGLISVDEKPEGGEVTPYYLDGYKYLNYVSNQEFAASIEAYTYPDEFRECEGYAEANYGLFVTNQKKKEFGLAYRTLVGNDLRGTDLGYKIHVIYNAIAEPSDASNESISDSLDPLNFSWDISTKPPEFVGHEPTSHFVIDSRVTPTDLLRDIEDILYGTSETEARLPSATELLFLFNSYQSSVFDAGHLTDTYFTTFDSGELTESQTSTIEGGSP